MGTTANILESCREANDRMVACVKRALVQREGDVGERGGAVGSREGADQRLDCDRVVVTERTKRRCGGCHCSIFGKEDVGLHGGVTEKETC